MIRLSIALVALAAVQAPVVAQGQLLGRAVLPGSSFRPGVTSGTMIGDGPINGIPVPFVNEQPVQGVSAIAPLFSGIYIAMSDNGFGSLENSADYTLALYFIRPDFFQPFGGTGRIQVLGSLELSDPQNLIPFPIANEFTAGRPLTGADFDIESFQIAPDFTFWIGDEFGPYLLHFNLLGQLIEAPIALPDGSRGELRSPQNGGNEEASTVRVMNAINGHAAQFGSPRPVCSPWHVMLDDGNPATVVGSRQNPPVGLAPASSEIHNVASLQRAGYAVVPYTINDEPRMTELLELGVDGIISDSPDVLYETVKNFDADGDGVAGDYLDAAGLIDINKVDAQGHRGGRNLRPENTLPGMEVALDYFMTTLELDCGVTRDGVAVLGHDPYVAAITARRTDGTPYLTEDEVLVSSLTVAEIQAQFVRDVLIPSRPNQTNNLALSPVSVLYSLLTGMPSGPYTTPTLQQVFDFVLFYELFYTVGPGRNHPEASRRALNASRVRFNVETKINPRTDMDERGNVFASRTVAPAPFAQAVAGTIVANSMQARADVQSFDYRTLLEVQRTYPAIRTVCLFGDFPKVGEFGDGTNLQPDASGNTPWLAGLEWPYRVTADDFPFAVRRSGGFEGMALSTDGTKLLPMLERPLQGGVPGQLLIYEFDLTTGQYNGVQHQYQLDPAGSAIGDYTMFSPTNGLIIERDGSQGRLDGFKRVFEVRLNPNGGPVVKRQAIDLLDIADPAGLSFGQPGDVGIGSRFAMPFVTIEGILYFGPNLIGVLNDNNFPFSVGRHVGTGAPDDNEFVVLLLDTPLGNF